MCNGNYTVYGLPISSGSVQAAESRTLTNTYPLFVPTLQPSDPRWVSAELAALDIACLGVLVTIVGGSLVGAFDYFLGDMRVARSGPYASAIKTAIENYADDAKANLQNVTSPFASANAKLSDHLPRITDSRLEWK